MKGKMLTLLILFANADFNAVKADLVVKPRDTEAVIGDSTYFDCASNVNRNGIHWLYYAVGTKDHEDICLYCMGRVHPQYENRIEVERNVSSGNFKLKIKSVRREDAGRYICQDNGGIGESTSAQLVILESSPTCTSNMKPDGVLGPNSCGLKPDTLHLSCQVSYHGNIPPVIKWRKEKAEDPVNPLFCQNIGNLMTCNLTMAVDLGLNGVSYICETTRSTTTQYNCVSDIIRIIYVKPGNSTKNIVQGTEEKVICSINSSHSCIQTWKWFDGVQEEIVANGSVLVAHRPGWYKCESECNIRSKQCIVLSKLVHVSEPQGLSMPVAIAVSCLVIIAVESAIVGLGYICVRKRIKEKYLQHLSTRQGKSLLNDKTGRPTGVKQHSRIEDLKISYTRSSVPGGQNVNKVTTKAAKERGLLIRGMSILGNELYVVTQKCPEVEVFDCKTLVSSHQRTVEELIRPSDMASCKVNKCLYIMDWKNETMKKEVLCVDTNGTMLRNWETGDDYGDLISVTKEKNIIVTFHQKNEFKEYSPEGIIIREVLLQGVEAPIQAIKLTNGDFLVSNADTSHLMRRVCIVDADGRVKQSFGGEHGSNLRHVDHLVNLAICEDGSVAVLDNGNRRVLLLDKDLQFERVLLSNKAHGLQNPTRLLLDESNDRLLVVDSNSGTGVILVFPLKEIVEC